MDFRIWDSLKEMGSRGLGVLRMILPNSLPLYYQDHKKYGILSVFELLPLLCVQFMLALVCSFENVSNVICCQYFGCLSSHKIQISRTIYVPFHH